jgi:hypothetical protein
VGVGGRGRSRGRRDLAGGHGRGEGGDRVETWSAGVDIAHRSGIENDCPDTELTRRFCRDKPWLGLCLFYTSGVGTRLTQQGKTVHKLIFAMNKRYTQSYPSFNKGVRHP